MDKPYGIGNTNAAKGVVVCAGPSRSVGTDCEVFGGYGPDCSWKPWQRLAAYKSMKSWLEYTIAEMEKEMGVQSK